MLSSFIELQKKKKKDKKEQENERTVAAIIPACSLFSCSSGFQGLYTSFSKFAVITTLSIILFKYFWYCTVFSFFHKHNYVMRANLEKLENL